MRVSYVELLTHCKKVFQACGVPYGCTDDGAEVVTWSEFVGIEGLQVLQQEISRIQPFGMGSVEQLWEENGLCRFNGNGQSAIILGKLIADYTLGLSETRKTVRVHTQDTIPSRLLAQPAHYIASRDRSCLVNYKTKDGSPMWILVTPETTYPVFVEGDTAEQIMQHNLTAELGQYETENLSSDDFWLVCTTETELVTTCMTKLRQEAKNATIKLIESAQLKATFEKAYFNGANVDDTIWNELDQIGRKTLVEATEQSRHNGAGEMAQ